MKKLFIVDAHFSDGEVWYDVEAVGENLENALENAIKFTRDNGLQFENVREVN